MGSARATALKICGSLAPDGVQMQKSPAMQGLGMKITGRGERIRTSGLYVPNVALYQAKLHPDSAAIADAKFDAPTAEPPIVANLWSAD